MNKPLLAAGALLLGGIVTGGAIFVVIVRRRGGSCADPGKCFSVCQRDAWLAGTVTNPDAVHFISELDSRFVFCSYSFAANNP